LNKILIYLIFNINGNQILGVYSGSYGVPERSALFSSSPEAGTALSGSHPFPRPQTPVSGYLRDSQIV
jgi:hypothetical protein